jgi:hypothetical protein
MRIRRFYTKATAIVTTALSAPVLWRSVRTALIVGLLLNLVNHGSTLMDGQSPPLDGRAAQFPDPLLRLGLQRRQLPRGLRRGEQAVMREWFPASPSTSRCKDLGIWCDQPEHPLLTQASTEEANP